MENTKQCTEWTKEDFSKLLLKRWGEDPGEFDRINCSDIREGEIVSRDRLSGDIEFNWNDDDDERKNLKTIGYVAYFKLTNGYEATFFMTKEEMNSHAKKYSQSFKKGFGLWKDDFYSMAQKTVLKLLLSKKAKG